MAQMERINTGSACQNSTKIHTESNNGNGSDRSDDSRLVHAGDSDKDNTKAPDIALPKQEYQGSIGSSTETMSPWMAIAAKARQGDVDSQYKLAEAYKMGTNGLSRSDE